MIIESLFPTKVFIRECNLDIIDLEKKCREHKQKNPTVVCSNVGGYQGHNFYDSDLLEEIKKTIPFREDLKFKNLNVNFWVNVNGYKDWNDLHSHTPYNGVFLSGVFYVKTPENCGNLRLYDPRINICDSLDMRYYNNGDTYQFYEPKENRLIIFPSWIQHMVEPNQSNEERISISFNILVDY